MNADYVKIKEDLNNLGIKKGDNLLIHSSYKSLGGVEGGIETVIKALLSVLGDSGTLLFPTLTFNYVTYDNPVFDVNKTPSCVGAISEFFRNYDGVQRSIHPTHSVAAIGKNADYFTSSHYLDNTPVGENSPFYKLQTTGGKLLFLGCTLKSNTSMHGVEEAMRVPYVLSDKTYKVTLIDGTKTECKEHYRHHITQNGYAQRYDKIENVYENILSGNVLKAKSYLLDVNKLWEIGKETIKKDNTYFVEKEGKIL